MSVEDYNLTPRGKEPDEESKRLDRELEERASARIEAVRIQKQDNRKWNERIEAWVGRNKSELKEWLSESKTNKFVAVGYACIMTTVIAMGSFVVEENIREDKIDKKIENNRKHGDKLYLDYALRSLPPDSIIRKQLQEHLHILSEKLPEGYFLELMEKDQKIQESVRKKEIPATPSIEGFDKMGVEAKDVRPLLDESLYPANFISGNVSGFVYTAEEKSDKSGASVAMQANQDNHKIELLKLSMLFFNERGLSGIREKIWPSLLHEAGHENDWSSKVALSPVERIKFLWEASTVFDNRRKYNTPLSDSASPEKSASFQMKKNGDRGDKFLFEYALAEWWAELCEGYLAFPLVFETTASPEEKALVEKWVISSSEGKKFNAQNAWEKRERIWKRQKDIIYKKLKAKGLDADAGFRKKK